MPRNWLTIERALIALGALALLTLFAFTRLVASGEPDTVAAVLDSAELTTAVGRDEPPDVSDGTADDESNRSTGAIPTILGGATGDGEAADIVEVETTTNQPERPDSGEGSTGDDGGEDGPADDPPAADDPSDDGTTDEPPAAPDTTVPPGDDSPGDSDDDEDGNNGDDGEGPGGERPIPTLPPEEPEAPEEEDEQEEEDPVAPDQNAAPMVWLTWSGYTLGGLTGQTTNPVTFVAGDADGDPVTFSATGMPPGLVIDQTTGTITGTFTAPCTCQVTIVVEDGRGGTGSVGFGWTVV